MDLTVLSQFSIFSNFSGSDLAILASYLEEEHFLKGSEIYYPGKVRDKMRLIVQGSIEVVADSLYSVDEPKAIYGPGQFMGETSLLQEGALHKARAHAMSDGFVYILTRAQFLKMMTENGRISCQLQASIGAVTFEKLSRGSLYQSVVYAGYSSGKRRLEHDLLGEREIPDDAYFGVQTLRALENFNITGIPLSTFPHFIRALAQIKKAAAQANHELGLLPSSIAPFICAACDEIMAGHWHDQFLVDMIQGGAGTSTNMNANEVIANRALELMGKKRGQYEFIHPNNHVNLSQSTNDAYPSAIRVAALTSLPGLVAALEELCQAFHEKSCEFVDVIKMGRTQLQDAVPMTLGQEFEAFSVTLREDVERIREGEKLFLELSLGGTAIGTGINSHPRYTPVVIEKIRAITGFNLVSSPNLIEATPDTGAFVLFSGILKRLAVKLSKICNDLRLLSSGPRCGFGDITLPPMQPGSSIMPGKVNPVIPEVVNQIAFQVIGNDLTITMAAEGGQLQLNAFEPVIVFNLFQSMTMLTKGMRTLRLLCVKGIEANREACRRAVEHSIGLVTALNPLIGYENATMIAKEALETGQSVFYLVLKHKLLSAEALENALKPENMLTARV